MNKEETAYIIELLSKEEHKYLEDNNLYNYCN